MVRVALLAEKADIKYNPSLTIPEDLVSSIKSLGYGASIIETTDPNDGKIELMVLILMIILQKYTHSYIHHSQCIITS